MKAVRPVTASNGVHSLQIRSVGSYNTSGRDKEGKKEGQGGMTNIKKEKKNKYERREFTWNGSAEKN